MSGLTKIFIVLQLVFSLALSVLLVLLVSKQDNYKAQVEGARTAAVAQSASLVAAQTALETANASVSALEAKVTQTAEAGQKSSAELLAKNASQQSRILELEAEVARRSTEVQTLTAANALNTKLVSQYSDRLGTLTPQVADITTKYNEVLRKNNELETQLRGSERAIRSLQEQIATGAAGKTGAAAPSEAGGQVANLSAANPTTPINGRITEVAQSAGRTLIETGLGSRDGVKQGTRLAIYRNGGYVGDAVVQRVTADQSVAVISNTAKQGDSAQKGDIVQTAE